MKRTAVAMFVALLVALAALAIRTSVSPDPIRADVEHALSLWADRPIAFAGTPEVRLLPWPRIRWTDVTLTATDDGTTLGRSDEIAVTLSPWNLLLGRAERTSITLRHPAIALPRIDNPTLADLGRRLGRIGPLRLSIVDGRLDTPDPLESIGPIDAELDWAGTGARISLEAGFRWHGAAARFTLRGPSPAELRRGAATPISVTATAPGLDAGFDGTFALDAAHRLDGNLSLTLADPTTFARWVDRPRAAEYLGGRLELRGELHSTATAATLAVSSAVLGSADTRGVLSLRWDTPELLAGGTLAFDTIDIRDDRNAFLGPGWATIALDRDRWPLALDLRLSAGHVVTRTFQLDKVAASLHLADRQVNAEIGEATLWNRPLSMVLRGDLADDGLRATVKGEVRDLPVTEIARLFGIEGFEGGTAGASFEADARCARLGSCLAALDGRLKLGARDLSVVGLAPFGDVSRFHPIVLAARSITRKTSWQRAELDLRILGQKAIVDSIEVIGDIAHFTLSGTGDLATGQVDLGGNATFPNFRLDPSRNGSGTINVPVRVGGSVRHLEVTPGSPTTSGPPTEAEKPAEPEKP